jgi:hypothetical protein
MAKIGAVKNINDITNKMAICISFNVSYEDFSAVFLSIHIWGHAV